MYVSIFVVLCLLILFIHKDVLSIPLQEDNDQHVYDHQKDGTSLSGREEKSFENWVKIFAECYRRQRRRRCG
ncbi:hypothetical protein HHI36_022147 [Cryptolaemus montrouzieri]|uniref:Uncharacterized protein n=1 Tax=Cryptolaemus montrouzieri TaxID=559131 RepID=A0ABD2MZ19_9CUCU